MDEQGFAYVVRRPCGCIKAAITTDANDASEHVAKWIKEGHQVDRVPDDEVRLRFVFGKCPHEASQLELFAEGDV